MLVMNNNMGLWKLDNVSQARQIIGHNIARNTLHQFLFTTYGSSHISQPPQKYPSLNPRRGSTKNIFLNLYIRQCYLLYRCNKVQNCILTCSPVNRQTDGVLTLQTLPFWLQYSMTGLVWLWNVCSLFLIVSSLSSTRPLVSPRFSRRLVIVSSETSKYSTPTHDTIYKHTKGVPLKDI